MSIPPQDAASLLRDKYGAARPDSLPMASQPSCDEDMARLEAGEPLAYVIGWQPFLSLKIWLDSRPLIPRPETEWIAERLIERCVRHDSFLGGESSNARQGVVSDALRVLDLCAGSGAIGCSILKEVPDAKVSFGELMPAHEATIRKNVAENELDAARADIRIGDLFAPFARDGQPERFDIIVSNPPYIPEQRALDVSVERYEPREALRGGADGLDIIRRIAAEAPKHLASSGELWLEVDAPNAEEARLIVERALGFATLHSDQYGRPRLVIGRAP